jgi:putative ABC transport system ATP-binding protein
MSDTDALLEFQDLRKDYVVGDVTVHALRGIRLTIPRGQFVAVVGASGSGKSTFMHIVGLLDHPTAGVYRFQGEDVSGFDRDRRAVLRNRKIGFVFQSFNLLARTSAVENVELPLLYSQRPLTTSERRQRALALLETVGLRGRADHTPNQLSGGQQQRVAIARALVTEPELLLADEPTGNLDTRTSIEIMTVLQQLNRERGITIVLITHEHDIAEYAGRVVTFRDGHLTADELVRTPRDARVELAALPPPEED